MTSARASHPLFAGLPLAGTVSLSTGPAPRPYTVTNGEGVFVYGLCDGAALAALTDREAAVPVRTVDGHGILLVIFCDFTAASLGPHREAHLVALVEQTDGPPVKPEAANRAAHTRTGPDVQALVQLQQEGPDQVAFCQPDLASLAFAPCAVQRMSPFRFAYLHPDEHWMDNNFASPDVTGSTW